MERGRQTADFGGSIIDGRYRLGERRADGAREAVHLPTARRVVVRQAPGDTAEAMRLKRTLQRAVALDHPALIPVLDAGSSESGLYLVEATVDGESLAALIGEPQPPDRVADVLRQLARVLAEAHGRGLFHGALRPEAVVLQQTTGRSDYVRLAGVGLSETPFAGRPGPWIAPEVADGQPPDARSDLYALGLMGRALLGGLGPGDAASGPLPGAPPALIEVLDALCRRSPGQRPPSAVAVLGPLERASTVGGGGRAMSDTLIATGPLPDVGLLVGAPAAPARAVETGARLSAPDHGRIDAPIDAGPIEAAPRAGGGRGAWIALVALLVAVIAFLLLRAPEPPPAAPAPEAIPAAAPPAPPPPPPPPDAAPPPPPDAAPPDAAPPDAAPPDAAPRRARRPRPPAPPPAPPAAELAPDARPAPRPPRPAAPPPSPADYEKL